MTYLLPDAAKSAIKGLPHDAAWKVLAIGMAEGRWGWDALEAHSAKAISAPAPLPRLPAKTRLSRWTERPSTPSNRFVRMRNLDPTLDWGINDGAARCLDLIISLCGRTGEVITFTSSLAKMLGRTSRTIQNYYRALVEAEYIEHSFDRFTGKVTIRITERCNPPLPNQPQFKSRGGAKMASPFKPYIYIKKDGSNHPQDYPQTYPQNWGQLRRQQIGSREGWHGLHTQ